MPRLEQCLGSVPTIACDRFGIHLVEQLVTVGQAYCWNTCTVRHSGKACFELRCLLSNKIFSLKHNTTWPAHSQSSRYSSPPVAYWTNCIRNRIRSNSMAAQTASRWQTTPSAVLRSRKWVCLNTRLKWISKRRRMSCLHHSSIAPMGQGQPFSFKIQQSADFPIFIRQDCLVFRR